MDQNSLVKALAFVLAVGLVLMLAWGTYKAIDISRTDFSNVETVESLDSNDDLVNVIESLESNWQKRRAYRFSIDQDPLYLGRALVGFSYASQGFMEFDEGGEPRLSATVAVQDGNPMAIIKYTGKSFVLKVGDKFGDGYEVRSIESQEVVVRKNGRSFTLKNQPVGGPIEEDLQDRYRSSEW